MNKFLFTYIAYLRHAYLLFFWDFYQHLAPMVPGNFTNKVDLAYTAAEKTFNVSMKILTRRVVMLVERSDKINKQRRRC